MQTRVSSGIGWCYTTICFYRYLQIISHFKRHNIPLNLWISLAHPSCCMSRGAGMSSRDSYRVVSQIFHVTTVIPMKSYGALQDVKQRNMKLFG